MKMILKEEGKLEVMENIKAELEAIEAERVNQIKGTQEDEPVKKKRFLGAGFDDSDDKAVACGVDREIGNYLGERKLKIDIDPFEWWRNRREECPVISKLARIFLVVLGTSSPGDRN